MLRSLNLRDIGPAARMGIELSGRLNLFTGDNGLGKTFVLDLAWWAMTGDWAGLPARPRPADSTSPHSRFQPQIKFQVGGTTGRPRPPIVCRFNFQRQEWTRIVEETGWPGLIVYARVDGGFSVWDSARTYVSLKASRSTKEVLPQEPRSSFHFTPETLWNGLSVGGATLCNGLIRDWVSWQSQPGTRPFNSLRDVVRGLAPSPDEPIEIGRPVRISALDVRDIPTLMLPYGEVPVVHASAGMKRIVSLAYLLTWAWDEHKRAAQLRRMDQAREVLLLIDEVESHLHPRWQRSLLPSLLKIADTLHAEADLQVLATTHAPLVMASVEPYWDRSRDSLFVFEYGAKPGEVVLNSLDWATQGDAVAWLTSPAFGLEQARSREAEIAIEAAEAFMRGDKNSLPEELKTKAAIQKRLEEVLSGIDPFWPRWIVEVGK